MADEKGYIIHAFQRSFQSRKSEKICLYGTGRHTWELLNYLKEYNIIGVLTTHMWEVSIVYSMLLMRQKLISL